MSNDNINSTADLESTTVNDEPQTKRRRLSSDETAAGTSQDQVINLEEPHTETTTENELPTGNNKVAEADEVDEAGTKNGAEDSGVDEDPDGGCGQASEKEDDSGSEDNQEPQDTEEEVEEEAVAVAAAEPGEPAKRLKPVKKKKQKKKSFHRKDIRKIMTVDQLDEETLAAQKEEAERLRRIAEKQHILKAQAAASSAFLPVSLEDAIKGIADNGMPLSLSDLYDDLEIPSAASLKPEPEKSASTSENNAEPQSEKVEPEVYTISSDEDEPEVQPIKLNTSEEVGPTKIENNFCKTSGGVVYSGNNANLITLDEDEDLSKTESETITKIESDDDDCIVISPPPSDQEDIDDKEDNNRPDEFGRVLVNLGHPENEPDIFLPQKIAEAMKPHQIGGVRFLYDNLVESLERYENSPGFGCIIAHSMGLGKTIQAAAFCEIFIRCTSARTVLVIVPINTVQNWYNEFNYWLPSEVNSSSLNNYKRKVPQSKKIATDSGDSGESLSASPPEKDDSTPTATASENSPIAEQAEEIKTKKLNLFVLNEIIKTLEAREKIISEWGREGGVLLIGYEMYRMLALRKIKKGVKKKTSLPFMDSQELNEEHDDMLNKIHKSLVRPGPDLVICDEGHRIKNSGASISQALKEIRTRRRVVLTGYPLQNNLMEYWCMVDFIRPNYLGTKAEFANMFERPISNGQCADSTPQDKRLMQFRSHVLHSLLQGFVQRKSHAVLKRALPPKHEHVFLVKMSPIQFRLYKEYINYIQMQVDMGHSTPNPIKAFAVCSKLWNHPDVLYRVMKKKQSVLLDDLELEDLADEVKKLKKATATKPKEEPSSSSPSNSSDTLINGRECIFTGAGETQRKEKDGKQSSQDSLISLEWASSCFQDYVPGIIENGTKFQLLFIIIEETLTGGDKLLIFSQSLLTLDLMETFLQSKYEWKKGQQYFRLDGSTQGLEREKLINEFNNGDGTSVFLVSTKAGSLGVNLVGANRVVVFDASWNPCHDTQAVCRIYRYGQKKPCQIYRFVTDYTLEKQIYDRQIQKGGMANRVVDEMNPDSHFNSKELISTLLLEIRDLEKSQNETLEHEVDIYEDSVIQTLLTKCGDKITRKPFEHESLLIDRKEKKLSAAERRQALRNYEIEKKASANYGNTLGRGPSHTSGGGIIYPGAPTRSSGSLGWDQASTSSSSNYSNYSYGRYSGESISKPVASIRPYHRGIYEQGSVSMVPNTKAVGSSMNWPAVIEDLRRKGVLTTQVIKLRKNYVMPNPTGGNDIYLRPGEKLELIRARKCSYIRLSNGQFMAMRRGSRGFTFLDSIPFSQQLNGEQLGIFLSSFLREIPPEFAGSSYQSPLTYNSPGPASSSSSSGLSNFSRSSNPPPVSFPLPPSLPYGSYSNHSSPGGLGQLKNPLHNNSGGGGGVRIWLKDHLENSATRRRESSNIIPEMELIKINSSSSSNSSRSGTSFAHHSDISSSTFFTSRSNLSDEIIISPRQSNSNNSQIVPKSYSRPVSFVGQSLPLFNEERNSADMLRSLGHRSNTDLEAQYGRRFGLENYQNSFSERSLSGPLQPTRYFDQQRPPTWSSSSSTAYSTPSSSSFHPNANTSYDLPDPEIEILKVASSSNSNSSAERELPTTRPTNGYEYTTEGRPGGMGEDISFPNLNGHGQGHEQIQIPQQQSSNESLQHQYYNNNDDPIVRFNDNLPIYPNNSHKIPDYDRFKYS